MPRTCPVQGDRAECGMTASPWHLLHSARSQAGEVQFRGLAVKQRVGRLDAQEETVLARVGKDPFRRQEFGRQAIDRGARHYRPSSRARAPGNRPRISEIEIIGSKRMNS